VDKKKAECAALARFGEGEVFEGPELEKEAKSRGRQRPSPTGTTVSVVLGRVTYVEDKSLKKRT